MTATPDVPLNSDLMVASFAAVAEAGRMLAAMIEKLPVEFESVVPAAELTEKVID